MSILTVPLHAIAHGRAGDKGNRSNISVIAFSPELYPYLLDQVKPDDVLSVFRSKGASGVTRYELPRLNALNFVIDDALEGGVNASLNVDGHGKSFSFLLLGDIEVQVPEELLPNLSPYRRS